MIAKRDEKTIPKESLALFFLFKIEKTTNTSKNNTNNQPETLKTKNNISLKCGE